MPQADGRRKRGCYFAHNNVLYVAKDRHISPIPVVSVTHTGRTGVDNDKGRLEGRPLFVSGLWLAGPAGGGLSLAS